jgi:catecholate siderophore receptor
MPHFRRKPIAMSLAILFSNAGGALAQTPPAEQTLPEVKVQAAPEEEGFRTDTTRGATRTDTPLRDIPQFINIVPQAVLESQGAKTLSDALRNVPGITYAAPEGGTQANYLYYIRGFQAGGSLFLDGLRDIGEYNRDLFAVDSVEVPKGPGGLMFGRGSTAGVINQVSKYAGLLPRQEVDVTGGSFDAARMTADVNLALDQEIAARVVALTENSGSYRYPQGVQKTGFAPSLRFGAGTETDVTLAYYYLKTKDVTDYGQPTLFTNPNTGGVGFFGLPPVSARTYYGYANHDYTDHETTWTTVVWKQRLARDLSMHYSLRGANYKRDLEATISTLAPTDANGNPVTTTTPLELLRVNRNHDGGRTRSNDDNTLISQMEVVWNTTTDAVKHTVLMGIEQAREKLDRWNYILDADPLTAGTQIPTTQVPLLSPDPYTRLTYTKTPNTRAKSQADSVAFYVQDQLELTQYWKAIAGLRWERYHAEAVTTSFATGLPTATGGPFERTDDMTSGRAGLLWQPSDTQSYYVAYGNAYNPSGELGVYGGNATNLNAQTQLLPPEEDRAFEVGAEWTLHGQTRLRSALFRNEKTNARIDVDPSAVTQTALAGKQRVDGLEMELAGRINPSWDIFGAFAYMDGKVVTDPFGNQGDELLIPKTSGSIWTAYRLGGGWEVGGGVFGSSDRPIDLANTPGARLPSYTRWDATAAYVQKRYEVRLNLFNLTDELYYYGGYQNAPNRVVPAQPRSGLLTFKGKFD